MRTNIIQVKYESKYNSKTFEGKAYTYYTDINVEVSKTNIEEYEIENIKPYLKTITAKVDKDKYLQKEQIIQKVA